MATASKIIDVTEKPGMFTLYISMNTSFENGGICWDPWSLKDRTRMTRRSRGVNFGCPSFTKLSVDAHVGDLRWSMGFSRCVEDIGVIDEFIRGLRDQSRDNGPSYLE